MNRPPSGYRLRNGYFEKTITFLSQKGCDKVHVTETIVRDDRGRIISVFHEKRGSVNQQQKPK
jgi:hypothetical protein